MYNTKQFIYLNNYVIVDKDVLNVTRYKFILKYKKIIKTQLPSVNKHEN